MMLASKKSIKYAQPLLKAKVTCSPLSPIPRTTNHFARTLITRAASTVVEEEKQADSQTAQAKRIVLESEDELKSTWEQRGWVGGATFFLLWTFLEGASQIHGDWGEAAKCSASLYAAWVLSDLGSGIYHWGVDNYGDANTPAFGSQIAAFQGHHQRPWTITEREFCNNVHKVFQPAFPIAVGLWSLSPWTPSWWSVWSSSFLFLVCMSQQFHAWSHMKKSELPGLVYQAQQVGLLINRKDHGAHHKAPFSNNYCIVSGMWNPILDKGAPDNSFFGKLEKFIHTKYGVEPRCWSEPDEQWAELARPEK